MADRHPLKNEIFKLFDAGFSQKWLAREPIVLSIEDEPKRIFPRNASVEKSATRLLALSPQGHAGQRAIASGDPNSASAVLLLSYGDTSVLFPGDAKIATWQGINDRRHGKPITAAVLVVSHHGGHLGWSIEDAEANLLWLYGRVVTCEYAVVSVGTDNQHGHPREDVLQALYAVGARVVCTEATEQCANCGANELVRRRKENFVPFQPSHSANHRTKVPCIGTVAVEVLKRGIKFSNCDSLLKSPRWLRNQTESCPASPLGGRQ